MDNASRKVLGYGEFEKATTEHSIKTLEMGIALHLPSFNFLNSFYILFGTHQRKSKISVLEYRKRMIEKYLNLFKSEVVEVRDAGIDDIPKHLVEHPKEVVYFPDIEGYGAVGNLWADRNRITRVLGCNLLDKIIRSIDVPTDYDITEFDMMSESFSLFDFPFPKYYPDDGGRYITAGIVFAEYKGKRNASFHRMMLLDDDRAAIRLVPRDLYKMHRDAVEHGEELKIAVVIGSKINVALAAATSANYETDELKIASSLLLLTQGERERAMRTPTGVIVPYNSEIVLEGRITDEMVDEGPFVDITGTYDIVRKQPVVVFDRFYYRNKIFHLIMPASYEHYNLMGIPREATIYREIRNSKVDVVDVYLTPGGCSWLHAVVKIRKKEEDDGRKAIMAAFRGHHSLKHVIVVDDDIDIRNPEDVEFAVATRFQGDRDLIRMGPTRGSSLDPSSYEEHLTIKMGCDATMPLENRVKFKRVKIINR